MPGKAHKHTAKWRDCVKKVGAKGSGDPYAICTATLGPSMKKKSGKKKHSK